MTKDEKQHLDKVASIGCVLCHLLGTPGSLAEIHHPRKGTGMNSVQAITTQSRYAQPITEETSASTAWG